MADANVSGQTVIDNSIARAKDPDKTQWADNQMLSFLKKGVGFIHRILIRENSEIAISTDDISLVAATQEYDLSGNLDNFWKIVPNGVAFPGGEPLTPITVEDAKREGTATTDDAPDSFYITADKIGLVNIPTTTAVASYPTLTCRYFAMEPTITLTAPMPWKNLFNEPVSSFADNLAILKTNARTSEYTAIYNALEESTLEIIREREGV